MAEQGRRRRTKKQRQRYGVMIGAVSITASAVLLLGALFNTQILQHDLYAREAADQHYQRVVDYPQRGSILDSEGSPLAVSNYLYTIGITPEDVHAVPMNAYPVDEIGPNLARILDLPEAEVEAALELTDRRYVKLKDEVDRQTYDELREYLSEYNIGGVAIDPVQVRYYPLDDLAAPVIGFTNDGDGLLSGVNGLEAQYNLTLSGTPGYTYAEMDNYSNQALPYNDPTVEPAIDGSNLKLHLNAEIQRIAQDELDKALDLFNLEGGGIAIIMNPKTGGVLAMAQSGSFDLNDPFAQPEDWISTDEAGDAVWDPEVDEADLAYLTGQTWINKAVSLTYEPGSIYKSLTAAMAIDAGTVDLTHEYSDQPIWVEGWTAYAISCSTTPHHGTRTLEEALWTSCNPVFVQIAQALGSDRFYDYVRAFGHLAPTGIDLPAETTGLNHSDPQPIDLATWSFGEQATVTAIQMINSYLPLGNGGLLMRPHIVDQIVDADGRVVETIEAEVVRRVISEDAADLVLHYMRGVVYNGGGGYAAIPGYHIAGKTGTSTSGEDEDESVISFASLAPGNDPEIAVLVSLNRPTPKVPSRAAQSVNREISEQVLDYLGIRPQYTDYDYEHRFEGVTVPDLTGSTVKEARQQAYYFDFDLDVPDGTDDQAIITGQYPYGWTVVNELEGVAVSTIAATVVTPYVTVPDMVGMDLNQVLAESQRAGINLALYGDNPRGRVTQQSETAGSTDSLRRHGTLVLAFEEGTTG